MNEGYHSLIFADYASPLLINRPSMVDGYRHTWDSWHLVPSSRPVFSPPPVKELYQEVPGSNGSLDYTESLTGYPLYGNREGSIEFWVINNQDMPNINQKEWSILYSEIMNYFHGKKKVAVLEDDPDYYYEGRWKVNDWKSDKERSIITVDYDLHPYKRQLRDSYNEVNLTANVEYTLDIDDILMPVTPKFTVGRKSDSDAIIKVDYTNAFGVHKTFNGSSSDGTLAPEINTAYQSFYDMILTDTNNTLKFKVDKGTAVLNVYTTGGML